MSSAAKKACQTITSGSSLRQVALYRSMRSHLEKKGADWMQAALRQAKVAYESSPTRWGLICRLANLAGARAEGDAAPAPVGEQRLYAGELVDAVEVDAEMRREEIEAAVYGKVSSVQSDAMFDQFKYHSVRIRVQMRHAKREVEVIADTGAGPSLYQDVELGVAVLAQNNPGRARLLSSASDHAIRSKGEAPVEFRAWQRSRQH